MTSHIIPPTSNPSQHGYESHSHRQQNAMQAYPQTAPQMPSVPAYSYQSEQQYTYTAPSGNSDHTDAINALFTFLEAAYPLKFKRAFPTDDRVIRAKRIWKNDLQGFNPKRILIAGKKAVDSSHFFPDLSDIRKFCKLDYKEAGLKEPLQAYYEACFAEPKTRQYPWSHIVVYLAAKQTGWLTLRSEEQRIVLPQFERNYEILCNRVLDGEDVEADILKGLEHQQEPSVAERATANADYQQQCEMQAQGINPYDGAGARAQLLAMLKKK